MRKSKKTETKITVETLTRYKVPCCSSTFKDEESAERYLALCDNNKENRTCETCGHVYCGDYSNGEECRAEERKVKGKYPDVNVYGKPYARQCPYWTERSLAFLDEWNDEDS